MAVSTMPSPTASANADIRPFQVEFAQSDIEDLRRRITGARYPSSELVADASQGVQTTFLKELARYWANDYDFSRLATRLNALPQFVTTIDGLDVHFIHVKSKHENALPMIITHGWPGSVLEMLDIIGPLTDPTAHGGSADDAFDLVIPSLPGYGFSAQPTEVGWGAGRIAQAWAELMIRLGYAHYVAQGGDQGASVADTMARQAPKGLAGIHLNLLSSFPTEVLAAAFGGQVVMGLVKRVAVAAVASRADKEQAALAGVEHIVSSGYIAEQNTKPQTVGYGTADSPILMAAWMLDHDADSYEKISNAVLNGRVTGNLTVDSVVDNLTLYWLTNTGTSAARLYWENFQSTFAAATAGQKPPDLKLPVAFTVFPQEIYQAPRSWAEKVYPNLIYFSEAPKGGHFAAWEEPQVFADEMRAAFKTLRRAPA